MADWSELPNDLLLLIAKCLKICFDVIHFRSVCSNWRASVPFNLGPRPTLCSPLVSIDKEAIKSLLVKRTIFLFKFPTDLGPRFWLVALEEDEIGKKHLAAPLPCHALKPVVLYPMELELDISNLQVQELGHEYFFQNTYKSLGFLCSHHTGGVAYLNTDPNDDHHFKLLIQDGYTLVPLRLFNSGDEEANTLEIKGKELEGWGPSYDLIQFKGKFYSIDNKGTTICIDPSSGASFPVAKSSPCSHHLVESCGNLWLVEMIFHISPRSRPFVSCGVFQLDEGRKEWDHLKDLGDGILFLGGSCKYFAPSIPGVEGNCIVFTMGTGSIFVFDLGRWTAVPLSHRSDLQQLFIPPAFCGSKGTNNLLDSP